MLRPAHSGAHKAEATVVRSPQSPLDLSSESFWARPFEERDESFAWLRAHMPVSWNPPLETPEYRNHDEPGFWALTLADDIVTVSTDHERFSSATTFTLRPQNPAGALPATFMRMDPPLQAQYRRTMAAMFTHRAVGRLYETIRSRAAQIVAQVEGAGEFDFVERVSARLPMLMIADFVGVPASLAEEFARAGDNVVSMYDPDMLPPGMTILDFKRAQADTLQRIGVELVRHRRSHPADDIATALAQAEVDGRALTDDEIGSMMLLLSIGGNDTTKQTTSHTMLALIRHPDQRAWIKQDLANRLPTAVEEFLRHASPIIAFARTATRDTEIRGVPIARGDKVAMFYCSGNRDESRFDRPHAFDVTRPRTAHVAFGGGGAHHCLGANLARAQLRAIFSEVLTRLPRIELAGDPVPLRSSLFHGIRTLPVRVG